MHNDVPLKKEIFGEDFFKNYMEALDNFLEENEQYFDDLED